MTDRTYPAGVPCWIDLESPDPEAAKTFYGGLFGWAFEDLLPEAVPGSYWVASLEGQVVGAIAMPGATAAWNTYVAVDDVDTAVAEVVRLGGTADAPEAAGPAGTSARCTDPAGVAFRLWQPGYRAGSELVNAPGSWNFSDLRTDDPGAAESFYGALFGWELSDVGFARMWRRPGYGDHLAATSDPGIRDRQEDVAAPPGFADCIAWLAPTQSGEPPHWHVTFAVADRDRSIAEAEALGATVVGDPVDNEWVHAATVRDPQGALLTLSQFDPQPAG